MIKLDSTTDTFLLNDIPYQRGKYRVRYVGVLVGIDEIGNELTIANLTPFDQWTDAGGTPYASVAALQTDLRLSIFFN